MNELNEFEGKKNSAAVKTFCDRIRPISTQFFKYPLSLLLHPYMKQKDSHSSFASHQVNLSSLEVGFGWLTALFTKLPASRFRAIP